MGGLSWILGWDLNPPDPQDNDHAEATDPPENFDYDIDDLATDMHAAVEDSPDETDAEPDADRDSESDADTDGDDDSGGADADAGDGEGGGGAK